MRAALRVCRKCLGKPVTEEAFFAELDRYIESLDPEVRVDQETYEQRLRICSDCEKLDRGMCRLCGCYVELRAVQRLRKCPDIPAKWQKQEGQGD